MPDAQTAIAIGRAVLIPICGKKILSEEPFTAKRMGNVWVVSGTLHCGLAFSCAGGAAEVRLSAEDARILHVIHYQ